MLIKYACVMHIMHCIINALPSSLMHSIANPKMETMEGKELGCAHWLTTLGGRGAC